MTILLSARDLCLFRGDRCLFQDLEFALTPGELLLVKGPNGSGKTSLLKALAGLIEFETGEVHWQGEPVARVPQAFRSALGWFSHRVGFKGDLTPVQNLRVDAALRPFRDLDPREVLCRVGIVAAADLPMRVLSAGQQRRTALARLLLSDASLWIMDEPLTNLDSDGQSLVNEVIAEHLDRGGIGIVASHQSVEIDAPTQSLRLS